MDITELLFTLASNGITTERALLAALNDNDHMAALGAGDASKTLHDATASGECLLALLVGDGRYTTEYFATSGECRAYCEAENALIIERNHDGDKERWLNDEHAMEWLPLSVAEWLDYGPCGELPEPYRFEHGHLYEYSPEQNAYIHCFVAHGCKTLAQAVKLFESRGEQ